MGEQQIARALGSWRGMGEPLSTALARAVREALLDGRIRAGSELPAERRLAVALGVSRGTVTAALARLRETGWVHTRHGSGSLVRLSAAVAERVAPLSATGDTGSMIDLRRAVPAAPQKQYLEATLRAAERAGPVLAEHGEPGPGLPELRAVIAARYSRKGTATRPEQILVTCPPGGLALWLRLSATPADTVVRHANEHGIALVAGPRFAADATLTHYLRVPFTPPRPVLDRVAAVLGDACAQGHGAL
ncbi:GntR family transcriptional regulator [Nonomuraea sp. NEAU-A123]|uniref:GntR family transcriptional regulator n=1 Tax=Nonomuraea sp. NEAU-A123 TaxID=2839649 RepID=UPI00203219D3|nr:GntR family transcriptional regulator [Nonomuraea sp. NEAU-A123]MBT2233328.1 GntR family transcriptional regulator [Nonomuraea sp. NEAU-A123]